MKPLRAGQRVQVSEGYHWAKGAFAKVCAPPEAVRELTNDWNGCVRHVKTLRGVLPFYWVEFDERQRDSDNEGPYAGAEIEGRYLIPVGPA